MLSLSHCSRATSGVTAASAVRFAELVTKIGTSASTSSRKRQRSARKKLNQIISEQRRQAKRSRLRAVSVTLTYRESSEFNPKHISQFLDKLRRFLKRSDHKLTYAWVLERAARLHYHLILWLPCRFAVSKENLKRWWQAGSTWVASCHSPKAWGCYMAKFYSLSVLPKGARVFGYGGLDEVGKTAASRAGLPRWLSGILPRGATAKKCPGGGWYDTASGQIYLSPYVWTPRGIVLAGEGPSVYCGASRSDI